MSASEGERDCQRDDEPSEYAKLPKDWLKVATLAQDSLGLCGNDQHATNDGDEANDQEGFKDELGARKREPQRIEQLRNNEDKKYAVENQEGRINTPLVDSLCDEPNGIGTDQGDRNDQDAGEGDVERDLEAVQHTAGASDDGGENRAEDVVR
jgi:hypothetical protein